MTPDFILGHTPDDADAPTVGATDDAETVRPVKVYDGLVVDPAGNPGTIGADSNGS